MRGKPNSTEFLVFKIVCIYAFFSSLWILFSDQVLILLTPNTRLLTELQTVKGWVFVLVTSGLLYGLVRLGWRSLQASHRLLEAVIEGTTDAVFVKDLQGRYVIVNSAKAEILDKPVAEILGKDDTIFLSPENARYLREIERTVITTGETCRIEETVVVNDSERIYLSTKDVYRDAQGNIIGLVGISQDISDRKRLEAEREQLIAQLRRETQDLAALTAVSANAISTLNLEELLNVLLKRIVAVVQADKAVILLTEGDALRVRACLGISHTVSGYAVPVGRGFAGTIAATRKPLYIEDAQTSPLILSSIIKQQGIHTMLGVPLKRHGNLVGVLHVDWCSLHPYSERELHLLEITAERCTMAILNAQLYEETKQLQEHLQLQFEQMPVGCILYDPEFRVQQWNPAAEKIFGYTREEALGKGPQLIVAEEENAHVAGVLQQLVQGGTVVHSINQNKTKDGRKLVCEWHNICIKKADGTPMGLLSMAQDITERQLAEDQLRRYAFYDGLTGLPNRTLFLEHLEQLVQRPARLFAVLYLDIDRFRMIKYSLGHQIANQLLLAVAERLQAYSAQTASQTAKISMVAHIATDEFAFLLEDIEQESDAVTIALALQQELVTPFVLNSYEVFTTASAGLVLSSIYQEPEELLQAADTATNQAKTLGKGRYVVFDRTMQAQAVRRIQLDTDLRRALERQEFLLHYQPIVSLSTHQLIGFEALVRWQHPQRGMVPPDEFIPLAEETGLIVPLGAWVLHEACHQLKLWQQTFPQGFPLSMSVNLSAVQLAQPGLLEQVDLVLQETGIHPECLKLEITETALMKNANWIADILEQLRSREIHLCIDDFGTGYSSLSYLHLFPFNTLKIDRSFVSCMANGKQCKIEEKKNWEIIRTIIILAHNLGMELIAEGIEITEQLTQLLDLQCEYGQGYLFSRPLDSVAAQNWMTNFL